MKNWLQPLAAIILTLMLCPTLDAQRGRADDAARAIEHGWRLDYAQAKREAKQSGKPLMVVFRCVP